MRTGHWTVSPIIFGVYQLCGPVTGRPRDEVVVQFGAAARILQRHYTCTVVDPTNIVPPDATHEDAMRICLHSLVCGGIDVLVTLPGWESSEGAALEVAVARAIGVTVVDIGEMWKEGE